MKPKYKHNNNITYSCKYHIVWCPKYRRKVLLEGVDVRLKEIKALVAIVFRFWSSAILTWELPSLFGT
jgi:putative transposase